MEQTVLQDVGPSPHQQLEKYLVELKSYRVTGKEFSMEHKAPSTLATFDFVANGNDVERV